MNTTAVGQQAEAVAADYLRSRGYKILAHNWRTKVCEIDLIAAKGRRVCFVEVKYRRQAMQGTGLDYITDTKLRRMKFAAELWVGNQNWRGEYYLAALEISGLDFRVTGFIEGFF